MSRAGDIAADYNAALADYRREQGIKTPGRPMPDLKSSDDRIESPFWLDNLTTGDRSRATLKKAVGGYTLSHDSADPFLFSPTTPPEDAASRLLAWLRRHNLRIAPRALTLTTFLRLLLADQFVHGIGGGRYDQVADRFIQKHFAVEPPYFAVTTGTLYFPSAVGRQRVCIPCLLQEGHTLHHSALGPQKLQLVNQINALPRRSLERRAAFSSLHRQLKDLAAPVIAQWDERLRTARQQAIEEETLFDRELFYAIQPRDRLEMLIERYDQILGPPLVGR
jgi:hypothetical protein